MSDTTAERFVVRLWDMTDGWLTISGPLTKEDATALWNEKTGNGTHNTSFYDGDYYAIYSADTEMLFTPDYFGR